MAKTKDVLEELGFKKTIKKYAKEDLIIYEKELDGIRSHKIGFTISKDDKKITVASVLDSKMLSQSFPCELDSKELKAMSVVFNELEKE